MADITGQIAQGFNLGQPLLQGSNLVQRGQQQRAIQQQTAIANELAVEEINQKRKALQQKKLIDGYNSAFKQFEDIEKQTGGRLTEENLVQFQENLVQLDPTSAETIDFDALHKDAKGFKSLISKAGAAVDLFSKSQTPQTAGMLQRVLSQLPTLTEGQEGALDLAEEVLSQEAGLDTSKATPSTDIDDFAGDAVEIFKAANPNATDTQIRKERNRARLQFKRAQAPEVTSTSQAEADVEIATVADIAERKQTGTDMGKSNMKHYDSAVTAVENTAKIDDLITHLETSDAITGLGADMLLQVERVKTLIGDEVAAGTVTDTEILDIMMGSEVFPLIKSLGIGARGLDTPAERDFLRKVMTGEISLNKSTLLRMANMRRDVQQRIIKRWNKRTESGDLDRFYEATGIQKQPINTTKQSAEDEADAFLRGE